MILRTLTMARWCHSDGTSLAIADGPPWMKVAAGMAESPYQIGNAAIRREF
jgi:hypothetical protein